MINKIEKIEIVRGRLLEAANGLKVARSHAHSEVFSEDYQQRIIDAQDMVETLVQTI